MKDDSDVYARYVLPPKLYLSSLGLYSSALHKSNPRFQIQISEFFFIDMLLTSSMDGYPTTMAGLGITSRPDTVEIQFKEIPNQVGRGGGEGGGGRE